LVLFFSPFGEKNDIFFLQTPKYSDYMSQLILPLVKLDLATPELIQTSIFTHKDIFQHIFFQLLDLYHKTNCIADLHPEYLSAYFSGLNLICKEISITTELWKHYFSYKSFELPHLTYNTLDWVSSLQIEEFQSGRVNKCIRCINELFYNKDIPINDYFYNNDEDLVKCLFFNIETCAFEKFIPFFTKNFYRQIYTKWISWLNERQISEYNPVNYDGLGPELRIEIIESGSYLLTFQFANEEDMTIKAYKAPILSEIEMRKILRMLLDQGLHPQNNIASKLIF
jgi:hypothetical protein